MLTIGYLLFIVALASAVAGPWLSKRLLSSEARKRRRRSRNYRRVASRRHGPAVKLAVQVGGS